MFLSPPSFFTPFLSLSLSLHSLSLFIPPYLFPPYCLSFPFFPAAIDSRTCTTPANHLIISALHGSEALNDDELIVIVPEEKNKYPPFVGVRGRTDWRHTFTGMKPSRHYRIELELASVIEVNPPYHFFYAQCLHCHFVGCRSNLCDC